MTEFRGLRCGSCWYALPAFSKMNCLYPDFRKNWQECPYYEDEEKHRGQKVWWRNPHLLDCKNCQKDRELCGGPKDIRRCDFLPKSNY